MNDGMNGGDSLAGNSGLFMQPGSSTVSISSFLHLAIFFIYLVVSLDVGEWLI